MTEVTEKQNGAGDAAKVATKPTEDPVVEELSKQITEITVSDSSTVENEQSKIEEEVHKDEENSVIAKKQVVKRGVTGKVKWFNVARGYGFIERDDNEQDVFLHQSAVVRRGRKPRFSLYLKGGEAVEFDVVEGLKGLEAAAVSTPGGMELATFKPRSSHRSHEIRNNKKHYRRPYRNNRKNNNKDDNNNTKANVKEEKIDDSAPAPPPEAVDAMKD